MTKPNFKSSTIWTGDNLEVMRGLNSNTVDLVYLDPPFNSNRNYSAPVGSKAAGAAFKDMWTLSDIDEHEHGELADRCPPAYDLIKSARTIAGKGMQAYLIFMAVRLLEMKRVLKDTGSIYLHCDDTAGAYLKLLMDSVFGRKNFRNEVIWRRHKGGKKSDYIYGRNHDSLLFYAASDKHIISCPTLSKQNESTISTWYSKEDKNGKYVSRQLTATGKTKHGDSGSTWRGRQPVGHWIVPIKLVERYKQLTGNELIGSVTERLETLAQAGLIDFNSKGYPSWRSYLSEASLPVVDSIWVDDEVKAVSRTAKERTGYPTQKPLALLERIIKASSNEGDVVLDPFCGCATTLVAAHNLGRNWIGCDLSELAVKLVNQRILEFDPLFAKAINPDNNPRRTDTKKLPNYRTHAHKLYGDQEGICKGCDIHFPFGALTVDHKLPRSKGGQDHLDNLQLLCTRCNSSKGNKTMAEWNATKVVA